MLTKKIIEAIFNYLLKAENNNPNLAFMEMLVQFAYDYAILAEDVEVRIFPSEGTASQWLTDGIQNKYFEKESIKIFIIPSVVPGSAKVIMIDKRKGSEAGKYITEYRDDMEKKDDRYNELLQAIKKKYCYNIDTNQETNFSLILTRTVCLCKNIIPPNEKDAAKTFLKKYWELLRAEILECLNTIDENQSCYKILQNCLKGCYRYWNYSGGTGRFTDGNRIEFLSGADDFYGKIDAFLKIIKNLEPEKQKKSYIRMAFWDASYYTPIPRDSHTSIKDLLLDAAQKGCKIQMILWKPSDEMIKRGYLKGVLDTNSQFLEKIKHNNIEICLQSFCYETTGLISKKRSIFNITKAFHQKIFIASVNGRLTAIIGGMNLTDWYYGVHDTALSIEGPGAFFVEQEWLRRWHTIHMEQTLPSHGSLMCQQIPEENNPVDIHITTTNTESWFNIQDTQKSIIKRIKEANKYIYIENFEFSSEAIMEAIIERKQELAQKKQELKVIIMLTHPKDLNEHYMELNLVTYAHFVDFTLRYCKSVKTNSDAIISRSECCKWEPQICYQGFLTDSKLVYQKNNDRFEILFFDISDIITDEPCFFYRPDELYIHSKLMLIDDEIAVIGSTNFGYKSMEWDTEISAFIINPQKTIEIRNKLIQKHGLNFTNLNDLNDWYKCIKTSNAHVVKTSDFQNSIMKFKQKQLDKQNTKNVIEKVKAKVLEKNFVNYKVC